ncbi:MAG: radical SAM protein [Phycisphaerae bacterium]|nr:radical SAM protein [Phycisphaerae bacterium]
MQTSGAFTDDERRRIEQACELLAPCRLCPRTCHVNRLGGQVGFCGLGGRMTISSYGPHFGEESVLVGVGGSGTVFLTGCNLGCLFCQNYEISIHREGREVEVGQVVRIMLELEERGCANINFVTPTPQAPRVLEAIIRARKRGLGAPIVYNCGGYESVELLRLLDGYIDIYMPDVKFFDRHLAAELLRAEDYPEVVKAAVLEMHRQVSDLAIEDGLATRGLLVRHLVMPGAVDDSKAIIDFLADQISPNTYVNVMAQYRPEHQARRFPQIARRTSRSEWREVHDHAKARGLRLAE